MGCGEDVWKPGRAWPRGGFSLSEAPFISPFVTGDACIVTGRVAAVRISLGSHQPPCASGLSGCLWNGTAAPALHLPQARGEL